MHNKWTIYCFCSGVTAVTVFITSIFVVDKMLMTDFIIKKYEP